MFVFRLKNTSNSIEIYITRALFVIAAFTAFVYTNNLYVKYTSAIVLLMVALMAGTILRRYRMNPLVLLVIGALITLFTSGSLVFAVVLAIYGFFLKLMKKETKLVVGAETITVEYALYSRHYDWADMNNVVLKDGLLTLDFRSNKIFQSEVLMDKEPVDEKQFNQFCAEQLRATDQPNKSNPTIR